MDAEQWWKNMVVAKLGVVQNQQQELPPQACLDEEDDTGGEQTTSSSPGGSLSGTLLTFSSRAVDGMHRQAGDAQRWRKFQTVAQEGGERGERQGKNWERKRLRGGSCFGFIAGPGEEHRRRKRRCLLRKRLRVKDKIIFCRKSTC